MGLIPEFPSTSGLCDNLFIRDAMKSTTIFAIVACFAMLGVAGIGALGTAQLAAAVPSENCTATIQTAIADRRVSASEREAIKDACGGSANAECLAAVQSATADRRVTQTEVQAIKAACGQ
jgi:hypothetical protein